MNMLALPPNVMARIAELADFKDLRNLRLVSKDWCDAVGYAQVRVRVRKDLAHARLPELCSTFWRATALNIRRCQNLEGAAGLVALHSLSQSLTELNVSKNDWLLEHDVALLAPLVRLNTLDLSHSKALSGLPESISMLTALRVLNLRYCPLLLTLPEGIPEILAGLRHLNMSGCSSLVSLPDAISGLRGLQVLALAGCKSLVALPESISYLASLERLFLGRCRNLLGLPETMYKLRSLKVGTQTYGRAGVHSRGG